MTHANRRPRRTKEADTPSADARAARFQGRHALHKITTVERCRDCGREPVGSTVGIRRTDDGIVGFAGVESCGRVWLCPVCNAKVMATRAIEIGAALSWAARTDRHVIWGSLTCQHDSTTTLESLLDIQTDAWRYVMNSREWRAANATITVDHQHAGCPNDCPEDHDHRGCPMDCDRKRDVKLTDVDGRVGYIRAAELTTGSNGWHPHFHPLIIWQGSREDAEAFAAAVVELWVTGVKKAGGYARAEGGQQLRLVSGVEIFDTLTGYVTKSTYDAASLALETVWSQGKSGRNRAYGTTSHWGMLASIEAGYKAGLADDIERWWELEEAMTGHRMITWSRGLRDFAGLGLETDDETEAAKEVGDEQDTVCYLSAQGWMDIRDRPEVLALILTTLEGGGFPALKLVLDAYEIEYFDLAPAY